MVRLSILLKRLSGSRRAKCKTKGIYVVKEVISTEESGSEILIMPSDHYCVTTMVDFGTKILGTQNANMKSISDFKTEISESRTFSFYMS
jgi:UDP-3-O-[3-hydroxymyristoyl] N-acetylglucosamine deacetylase/3-hydroxyacyl-[acyl-carrier-protein] dehydratase